MSDANVSREECEFMAKSPTPAVRRLARDHLELLDKSQWQPIETAPKDGTWILCAWKYRPCAFAGNCECLETDPLDAATRSTGGEMKEQLAWAVCEKKLVAYGNGAQSQYPIFPTRKEAKEWQNESLWDRGELKIVRVKVVSA